MSPSLHIRQSQGQSQRQSQKQTITPVMVMELSLLQLPIGELRAAVKRELDSNPALEVELPRGRTKASRTPSGAGTKEGFLENYADERGETLDEHLLAELRMSGVEGRDLALARAIVENLDGDGRFTGTYADLAMVLDGVGVKGVRPAELEAARQRVMATDPKGCGARDLAECYRAQLDRIPASKRADVEAAIEYVAATLAKQRIDADKMPSPAVLRLLKTLEAYPGRLYDFVKATVVVPDIIVDAKGGVRVDQADVPELRVSPKYVEMAKDREIDEETRAYAAERVHRAREFRAAVVRRRETMEKIAESVIERQRGFLKAGASGLKKLTMSALAKDVKTTVSTVSRAAARKYVRTPRGTVPLRKLFVLVDQAPIEKLREILASFPAGKRPSDEAVAAMMAKAGYAMARRTVAKYRVKLGFC